MSKFSKRGGGNGKEGARGGDRDGKRKERSDSGKQVSKGQRGGADSQRKGKQVDRRDKSKQIKKGGDKGPRKISTAELRQERSGKGQQGERSAQKGGKGGKQRKDKRGKGGRFGRKGGKPKEQQATAEALDKDLEGYWVKGGHSELATQRLDDDLADYWKNQETEAAAPAVASAEQVPAAEEKKE